MTSYDHRIKILEESEINELYGVPVFTDAQREHFFTLDDSEKPLVSKNNDATTNVYRILLLGYFKYKPVILNPSLAEIKDDLIYIRNKYKYPFKLSTGELSQTQKSRIYNSIIKFSGFVTFNDEEHRLTDFVSNVVKQIIEPKAIFDSCIHYLAERRIPIPGYSTLQKIIANGIRAEESEVENKLSKNLSDEDITELQSMVSSEENQPLITRIKKLPKSFKKKEMYAELEVLEKLQPLFPKIKIAVESLDLSKRNIEHFAGQVTFYSLYRLKAFSKEKYLLYLSCFLYQRYFQIIDIIVQAFVFHVRKLADEALVYAKEKHHAELKNIDETIDKASALLGFYVDEKISGDIAFDKVRKKAFKILTREEILKVKNFLARIKSDLKKHQWEYYEQNHSRIKGILRKLFICLDFNSMEEKTQAWLRQIHITRQELIDHDEMHTFDARLIKRELKPHLNYTADDEHEGVNMKRAEMLLYMRARDRIEDQQFFIDESQSYKWYKNDYVPAEDVEHLISICSYPNLKRPIDELLAEKAALLEKKRKDVGARIAAGDNNAVVFVDNNGKRKWIIKQGPKSAKKDKSENFYRTLRQGHIGNIIAHVERATQFSKALAHRRLRKTAPDLNKAIACIVANGTRYGTHQMADLCGLNYDHLREFEKNYLRVETIHRANDIVSDAIARLEIFKHYNIQPDVLHGSFDGQRLKSKFNTISTHFSSKYFGRGQGLSAVTLSLNFVPVNADIMKLNGHESHYLFDVLHNNTSEIQPDVVSTDTHGSNQFNFSILDFFGYTYAPRYARPGRLLTKHFSLVDDEIILVKPINYKLIADNWSFIQQIMMSLDSREVSQANIVRKMSRYESKNSPFKALAEYDRLIRSIYLLDFIDDSTFRGYIQRALNRGESYHMLQRRIEQVNGGQFRGESDDEIFLWYECSRLIANCVIYFNSCILSFLLLKYERENELVKLEELKRSSPVAWTHINFNGSYSFSFDGMNLDMTQLLNEVLPG